MFGCMRDLVGLKCEEKVKRRGLSADKDNDGVEKAENLRPAEVQEPATVVGFFRLDGRWGCFYGDC